MHPKKYSPKKIIFRKINALAITNIIHLVRRLKVVPRPSTPKKKHPIKFICHVGGRLQKTKKNDNEMQFMGIIIDVVSLYSYYTES